MKDGDAMKNSWISIILVVGATSAVLLPGYAYAADVRVNDEDGVLASTVADGTEFSNSDPLQELLHQKYENKPSRSADHPSLGLPKFLKETFLYGYEDVKRNERQAWPADSWDVRGRTYPNQRQPRNPGIEYRVKGGRADTKKQQPKIQRPTTNYRQPQPNPTRVGGYTAPVRGTTGKGGKGNQGRGGGSGGGKVSHKPGGRYIKKGRSSSGRRGHKGRGRGSSSGVHSGGRSNSKYRRNKLGRIIHKIRRPNGYRRGSSSGIGGKIKYKRRKQGKSSSRGKKYRHHSKSKSRKGRRKGKHGKKGRRSGSRSSKGRGRGRGRGSSHSGKNRRRKYHNRGGSSSNGGSYVKGSSSEEGYRHPRPATRRRYDSGYHSGGGGDSYQNLGGPRLYRDKYRQASPEEHKETYSHQPSYWGYNDHPNARTLLDEQALDEQGSPEAPTEDDAVIEEPEEDTTTFVDPFLINWDEDVRE